MELTDVGALVNTSSRYRSGGVRQDRHAGISLVCGRDVRRWIPVVVMLNLSAALENWTVSALEK